MDARLFAFLLLGLLAACAAPAGDPAREAGAMTESCVPPGQWVDPAGPTPLSHPVLIESMSTRQVVLLGEGHVRFDHHRWQLHTIAALHGRNPNMVLAFESFPRRVQPVLDRWTGGELSDKRFLEETDWNEVWRFDPALYMPLFDFARLRRIPMIAMNVDRPLINKVRRGGWKEVPAGEREGVGDPAPAGKDYLNSLAEVYGQHRTEKDAKDAKDAKAAKAADLEDPDFLNFVDVQLTWDRAMAEAILKAANAPSRPLVVGIVGLGHLQYRHGISHQLEDLGISDAAVLLPWDRERGCADLADESGTAVADALFGLQSAAAQDKPKKPLLGVRIQSAETGGLRIIEVVGKSVAETAGLAKDDLIVEAAGTAVDKPAELIAIVHRQAPGTWLPLRIRRGGETLEVVAKFPPLK